MWRALVAALVFIGFVPGVLVTLPSKSSKKLTVLIVHALLFAFVLHWIMKSFYFESFGNHGAGRCPPGYAESVDSGGERCVPSHGSRSHVGSTQHEK
jgi:hypothetical protein